jgi:hypothetical protein
MLESLFTAFIQQKTMSQTSKSLGRTVNLTTYSPDYATARQRFIAAAAQLGFTLLTYPIAERGPHGELLTVDVAIYDDAAAGRDTALILSSGIHGVEGYFGSALQLSLLAHWLLHPEQLPTQRIVLIHALNPYGFAWRRRANEDNVDLNRNLILPHEQFHGSPPLYAALDQLLNPPCAPQARDGFPAQLAPFGIQYGINELTDAITCGQYDFPNGLYYGGSQPSALSHLLSDHLKTWLGNAQQIIHLDVHTGLGTWARYKLLFDHPITDARYAQMQQYFGADVLEAREEMSGSIWSGGLGHFCRMLVGERDYVCAVAEFGTYTSLKVLGGMRTENQSYVWLKGDDLQTRTQIERSKQRLVELFCPSSTRWRQQTLRRGLQLISQALKALQSQPDSGETEKTSQPSRGSSH